LSIDGQSSLDDEANNFDSLSINLTILPEHLNLPDGQLNKGLLLRPDE
jgi:hypothetical protein